MIQRFAASLLMLLALTLNFAYSTISVNATSITPVTNGKIVFTSNRTGEFEIFTMNPDGSDIQQLTFEGGTNPTWSPDGTQILFTSYRSGDYEIYSMNADGSYQFNLTNRPDNQDWNGDWSPDMTKIVFDSQSNYSGSDIFIMNVNGSNPVKLTNSQEQTTNILPIWSPDGTKIAFVSDRAYGVEPGYLPHDYDLYLMQTDGSNPTRTTIGGPDFGYPAWSNDGSKIVFSGGCYSDHCEIGVTNYDGTTVEWITNDELNDIAPAWSPDGEKIVFSRRLNNQYYDIYVMDSTGQNKRRLTFSQGEHNTAPSWQPILASSSTPSPTFIPTALLTNDTHCATIPNVVISYKPDFTGASLLCSHHLQKNL